MSRLDFSVPTFSARLALVCTPPSPTSPLSRTSTPTPSLTKMSTALLDSLTELPGFNGYLLATVNETVRSGSTNAASASNATSSTPTPPAPPLPLIIAESGAIPAEIVDEVRRLMLLCVANSRGGGGGSGSESLSLVRGSHKVSVSNNGRYVLAVSWEVGKSESEGQADGEHVPEGL